MDIGKSFTYVFEDPNWIKKVLIGGIVSIIPIVNFAAIGFALTTLKNVADGQAQPLPEWGNFGDHFMKGLYAVIGILVYFLPAILIWCCIFVVSFAGGLGASSTGRSGSDAIGGVVAIVALCLQCILGLYALFAAVTLWAPLTRFAMSQNQLSVFWDLRGNFELISKNIANYIIALLIAWVAGFVAGFGMILCIIGVFFTSFWSQLVNAHIFAQFWRASQGQGTVPAAA